MKIATLVREVPAPEARILIRDGRGAVEGATIIDGMDEYGVEEALRLREAGDVDDIVIIGHGRNSARAALLTGLAMGADRAIDVVFDTVDDITAVARTLAAVVADEGVDLVLCGGRQSDWDSAALGPALAEALGWPLADWATSIRREGRVLHVTHDVDGGREHLRVPLPAVVTTQQGLNEPRYPTLPNTMKARRKPVVSIDAQSLDADHGRSPGARCRVVAVEVAQTKRAGELLQGDPESLARTLVERLRAEVRR